jgi:hypothetical protein
MTFGRPIGEIVLTSFRSRLSLPTSNRAQHRGDRISAMDEKFKNRPESALILTLLAD